MSRQIDRLIDLRFAFRILYNTWLKNYLQNHPDVDPYKIVFDNQARILSFDFRLPDIGPNVSDQINYEINEPLKVLLLGFGRRNQRT